LYLLLTAERSRDMLRTARTVIIDEIHAVIETRRGAHLALSLERLDHAAGRRLQRIGLSATQKPIEQVAEFLTGAGADRAQIVDEGHVRELEIGVEVTASPLEAVMSAEAWGEVYDRLTQLIEQHRTTIVFVNTRRLAERVAKNLSERLGIDAVTAHHGSLAKDVRLDAEDRLKGGRLRALVATASLELGIDIGHVDLVCQLASPRRIATFLQRVGRSGHTVHGRPKGRFFPLTRDDLIEGAALLRAVRRGELDRIIIPPQPTDVLAQQIVAEAAAEDWNEDALYQTVRRAYPYRELSRAAYDEIVRMLARGISTHRGRRGALIHHDAVNGRIRGRKGARMLAITSGGAIPDVADYRVVLEPDNTFIGTVNEDFAVESMVGDVFQLGNTSWRVLKIETGIMRVADARGEPPSIPFWLGEAPARSDELSAAVADLRADVAARLGECTGSVVMGMHAAAIAWLVDDLGLPRAAAEQIVLFLAETKRLLGAVPTQRTLVLERFFDEGGGMQLVL
ncbi:MAG: helicase-related protein, partial [Longimicrobiales bacterium]